MAQRSTIQSSAETVDGALELLRSSNASWEEASTYKLAPETSRLTRRLGIPLPPIFQHSYFEYKSFIGLFPQIGRVWLTADSRLYLWSYVDGHSEGTNIGGSVLKGDLYAYEGLEQIIVAVALVRPVPGVFVEEIQWLLAVATPVEVTLLGVTIDEATNELTLLPTDIAVSTDGTLMTKIIGTNTGRVFMAGMDGQLHELSYSALKSSVLSKIFSTAYGGAGRKRARKVTHNPSFLSSYLIPESIKAFFSAGTRLDDIAYDKERMCLYTLTNTGIISLYHVKDGESGASLQHVASVNALKDASRHALSVSGAEREIVSLFPTSSPTAHLVAVTSYGERLYYTTAISSRSHGFHFANGISNNTLNANNSLQLSSKTVSKRDSPSEPALGLREIGWRGSVGTCDGLGSNERLCIHVALWSCGSVLMSDLREGEADMVYGIFPESRSGQSVSVRPNVPSAPSSFSRENRCLEQVSTVSLGSYGEKARTLDFASAMGNTKAGDDEVLDLPNVRTPSFWVLTDKEIVLYERRSPIELLRTVLKNGAGNAAEFFAEHGVTESSAMCVELAVTEPAIASNAARALYKHGGSSLSNGPPHQEMKQEPTLASSYAPRQGSYQLGRGPGMTPVFDIGRPASTRHPQDHLSGAHDGIALYLSKVLSPLWARFILKSRDPKAYPRLSAQTSLLSMVRGRLFSFILFLNDYAPDATDESRTKDASTQNGTSSSSAASPAFGLASHAPWTSDGGGSGVSGSSTLQDRLYRGLYKMKKANERRRLEYFAIMGLKDLASRTVEALALIMILDDHQLPRLLAVATEDVRDNFCNMRYCDLIAGENGPGIASALLEALFSSYTDEPSVIERIGGILHERSPSFFGKDDRSLHHGLGLLRKAVREHRDMMKRLEDIHASPSSVVAPPETVTSKANEATKALSAVAGRIPDLSGVCRSFAEIGAYANLVAVALSVANDAEAAADTERLDAAYQLIFTFLETLFGHPAGREPNEQRTDMTPGSPKSWDKAEARTAALKVALGSNSDIFHNKLYEFLLRTPSGEAELLKHPTSRITKFLETPGRENLLWRCLVQQERHVQAAQVLIRMAEMEQAESKGEIDLSLGSRVNYLTCAVHNAKTAVSSGDRAAAAVLGEASDLLDVAQVQIRLRNKLQTMLKTQEVEEALDALNSKILDLSCLYNTYARPLKLWENALDILNCGNHQDESLVSSIWENLLKEETQAGVEAVVVDRVSELAHMLYPGPAFPVGIVLRLLGEEAFRRKWWHGLLWSAMRKGGVPWGKVIDGFRSLREVGSWLMEEKLIWLANALLVGLEKSDIRGRDQEAAHELVTSLKARLRALSGRESGDIIRRLEAAEKCWTSDI